MRVEKVEGGHLIHSFPLDDELEVMLLMVLVRLNIKNLSKLIKQIQSSCQED